jgi:hypothetical protein
MPQANPTFLFTQPFLAKHTRKWKIHQPSVLQPHILSIACATDREIEKNASVKTTLFLLRENEANDDDKNTYHCTLCWHVIFHLMLIKNTLQFNNLALDTYNSNEFFIALYAYQSGEKLCHFEIQKLVVSKHVVARYRQLKYTTNENN